LGRALDGRCGPVVLVRRIDEPLHYPAYEWNGPPLTRSHMPSADDDLVRAIDRCRPPLVRAKNDASNEGLTAEKLHGARMYT
jgi:hypothetical protein